MLIEPEFIKCACSLKECTVYNKCCFLPTEIHPGIDGTVRILFVGQGGGTEERQKHRPFIGRSGKRLRQQIIHVRKKLKKHIGVAFSNTIRDNPDRNRTPSNEELRFCLPFLYRDIALLKQRGLRVVMPLGYAAKIALIRNAIGSITGDRGHVFMVENPVFGEMPMIPSYHPSYVSRTTPLPKDGRLPRLDNIVVNDIIYAYEFACGEISV